MLPAQLRARALDTVELLSSRPDQHTQECRTGLNVMKIYYAPNTRAVRIVWLFEELGLPYELQRYKLGDAGMRSPDYLKVHPMGRVPVLEDGETTIFESGAIVQYVLAKYGDGRLAP